MHSEEKVSATIIISHYIKMTYADERNGDAAFPVPLPPTPRRLGRLESDAHPQMQKSPPLMDARHLQIIEI